MLLPYMMDDSLSESATLEGPVKLGGMDSLIGNLSGPPRYYDNNSSSEDNVLTVPAEKNAPCGPAEHHTNLPSDRPYSSAVSAVISGFAPSRVGLDDGLRTSFIPGQAHPPLSDMTVDAQLEYAPSLPDVRSPGNTGQGREEIIHSSAWSADAAIPASHVSHGHSRSEGSITPASSTSLQPLLHVGVRSGNRNVVSTLLKHGAAEVDERDQQGCTALHVAVELGDKDLVLTLLQHSANIHSRDAYGRSALYLAVSEGHNEILELLLRYASITTK